MEAPSRTEVVEIIDGLLTGYNCSIIKQSSSGNRKFEHCRYDIRMCLNSEMGNRATEKMAVSDTKMQMVVNYKNNILSFILVNIIAEAYLYPIVFIKGTSGLKFVLHNQFDEFVNAFHTDLHEHDKA